MSSVLDCGLSPLILHAHVRVDRVWWPGVRVWSGVSQNCHPLLLPLHLGLGEIVASKRKYHILPHNLINKLNCDNFIFKHLHHAVTSDWWVRVDYYWVYDGREGAHCSVGRDTDRDVVLCSRTMRRQTTMWRSSWSIPSKVAKTCHALKTKLNNQQHFQTILNNTEISETSQQQYNSAPTIEKL